MEVGLNKVKTELKNLKNPQSSEDKFHERMEVKCIEVKLNVFMIVIIIVGVL